MKAMQWRIGLLFLIGGLALSACGLPAVFERQPSPTVPSLVTSTPAGAATATEPIVAAPTATQPVGEATSAPANTPEATATAVPATETPAATATTSAPATPDPNERLGDVIYQDTMDGRNWFWGFSDDAASLGIDGGVLKATMARSDAWWRFSVGPEGISGADQQVRVLARTVTCEPDDEFGVAFRAAEAGEGQYNLYLFNLTCGGLASFEVIEGTERTTLVDWTASPALRAGTGAENELTAWMDGDEFRFYANGQYLFSARDSRLAAGYYGFFVYDRSSGGLEVHFDDLAARAVN